MGKGYNHYTASLAKWKSRLSPERRAQFERLVLAQRDHGQKYDQIQLARLRVALARMMAGQPKPGDMDRIEADGFMQKADLS